MKILRSSFFKKRKCEFGNFELEPEKGWKISQSFIDYESGLLIVRESDENEKNWLDTGFGSRTIPIKEYRIDVKTCEILNSEQWKKHFSYETTELISEDGKYKLITTRIHESERDSDGIKEELIDIESGKTLSSSSSIAFRAEKRENLLEAHYSEIKEQEIRKAKLDAMPTLQEFFLMEFNKLNNGDIILDYYDADFIFKLTFNQSSFELSQVQETFKSDLKLESLNYEKVISYTDINEFVTEHLKDKNWFLDHSPINRQKDRSKPNQLLKKFVLEYFNDLRFSHDFTFEEHAKIQQWENLFYQHDSVKPEEYKQFCPLCKAPVLYYPRYPKYICNNCSSKMITDETGLELSFSNIGFSGGLRIVFKKNGEIIKEDTSQSQKLCFIEGNRFIATEARFGGIVIQTEK